MNQQPLRADYTYTVEETIIAIVDLDQGSRSVTNDIENVLDEISAHLGGLAGYAIIYRDSRGVWDGVRLERGVAVFYGLNETELEGARNRLLHVIA